MISATQGVRRFQGPVEHVAPPSGPVRLPNTKGNSPFILAHHPMAWQFMDASDAWLPLLSQIAVVPGVNGVGEDGGSAAVVAKMGSKGMTVLMPGDARLGALRRYDSYWYDCERKGVPGRYYCLPFQRFSVVGKVTSSRVDEAGHREWLAELVRNGAVEPMPEEAFDAGLSAFDEELRLVRQRSQSGAPSAVRDLEAKEARRARMVAAWERTQGGEPPAEPEPQPGPLPPTRNRGRESAAMVGG